MDNQAKMADVIKILMRQIDEIILHKIHSFAKTIPKQEKFLKKERLWK